MTMKRWGTVLGLAMALLCLEATAANAQNATLPVTGGTAYIGQVNGWAAIVHQAPNGTCTQIDIDPGGLQAPRWITGSEMRDVISISFDIFGPTVVCNRTITPLISNSHALWIQAMGGDDAIYNFTHPAVNMAGNGGNDVLYNFTNTAGTYTEGGGYWGGEAYPSGNDFLYVGQGQDAHGNNGNDRICVNQGSYANTISGGSGFDTVCGPAVTFSSIEGNDCNCSP